MADALTHIDTLDVELEPPQQQNIEVGATAEQLLPLIDANQNLAAANRQLVEQVLPTLRGGLQTKEVAPADIEQVITPDDGYLGLQRVKVAPYEREVQVVNRRANESEFLYYMEDIATQYQRSDYAVCMAGEFYKNADTTILAGADAYLTSDGDFYDVGTTHTWHDDDDMHANRWVVYYFKEGENKSNFMIADASACPTVLAVKGHLGAIICNITVYVKEIIIPDDSSVLDIRTTGKFWDNSHIVIGNILNHTTNCLFYRSGICRSITCNIERAEVAGYPLFDVYQSYTTGIYLPKLKYCKCGIVATASDVIKNLYIPVLEEAWTLLTSTNIIAELDLPYLRYSLPDQRGCTFFANGTKLRRVNMPIFEGCNPMLTGLSYQYHTLFANCTQLEELHLPKFRMLTISANYHGSVASGCTALKRLILPQFTLHSNESIFKGCTNLEYVYVPKCTIVQNQGYAGNQTANMPNLKTYIIGKVSNTGDAFLNCPRLIHLEAVMTQDINVQLPKWEPTEALNDNTDLIEDTNRCTTNREQFFVNFVEYILHKLQDRTGTSKLTLTLSATVYDAIFNDESGFEYEGQPIGGYVTSYIAGINWSVAKAS